MIKYSNYSKSDFDTAIKLLISNSEFDDCYYCPITHSARDRDMPCHHDCNGSSCILTIKRYYLRSAKLYNRNNNIHNV